MSKKNKHCPYCQGDRINIPRDEKASDFCPNFADIESDVDGHCLSIGTPNGNMFLIIEFCPKCGREL